MNVSKILLAGCAVYLSWLAMQGVHEFGHVLAAWGAGGTVERVVFHPLGFLRTDVSLNPRPLVVAWGGPVVGATAPLLAAVVCHWFAKHRDAAVSAGDVIAQPPRQSVDLRLAVDFFAGFCLIANGAYIGVGSFGSVGDAGDLLRHGSPQWLLIIFGVVSIAGGLFVWHRALKRYRRRRL